MGSRRRGHRIVGHTADVGLEAFAPDLPGLFEEAAAALAGVAADVGSLSADETQPIDLQADDLEALAYAWLNELNGLAQARGGALVRTEVLRLTKDIGADDGWRLVARAWFAPFGDHVRARVDVKSATYHRLAVHEVPGGWTMSAYLDI